METLACDVSVALRRFGSDSPEFDSALVALAAAARAEGLRGSAAVAVLSSAIRAGLPAPACPVVSVAVAALAVSERDSAPLG